MHTFILTFFWLYLIVAAVNIMNLIFILDDPSSAGENDGVRLLSRIAFSIMVVAWAANLLW